MRIVLNKNDLRNQWSFHFSFGFSLKRKEVCYSFYTSTFDNRILREGEREKSRYVWNVPVQLVGGYL